MAYISILVAVVILFVFIVWVLFFSSSKTIGKFLYELNNRVETKKAGLNKESVKYAGREYVYLTNKQRNKPIMILLHGFSADKNVWLKFANLATKDFTLFIPDLMGHGEIPYVADQCYSTLDQSIYVAGLIDFISQQHPSQCFVLVGNSMGGMITAQLLKDWHDLPIANLNLKLAVLLDPAGAATELAKQMHASKHNPFFHIEPKTVLEFYETAMHKPPFIPPSVLHYLTHVQYLDKATAYTHMYSDFFNIDTFYDDAFSYKSNPPLVVWGEMDRLLPVTDSKKWQSILGVEPIILKKIGHMPMVECPRVTYNLIAQTISSFK